VARKEREGDGGRARGVGREKGREGEERGRKAEVR